MFEYFSFKDFDNFINRYFAWTFTDFPKIKW